MPPQLSPLSNQPPPINHPLCLVSSSALTACRDPQAVLHAAARPHGCLQQPTRCVCYALPAQPFDEEPDLPGNVPSAAAAPFHALQPPCKPRRRSSTSYRGAPRPKVAPKHVSAGIGWLTLPQGEGHRSMPVPLAASRPHRSPLNAGGLGVVDVVVRGVVVGGDQTLLAEPSEAGVDGVVALRSGEGRGIREGMRGCRVRQRSRGMG